MGSVVIVNTDVAGPLPGVTVAGLNVHVAFAGIPEVQLRATDPVNPFAGVIVTVEVTDWPDWTGPGKLATVTAKSGDPVTVT